MYVWDNSGLGGLNYPSIDTAIQKFEGYAPGTLAYQNNNPGNLVYASWESAYGCQPGGAGGFAKCPSYDAGQQIQDALVTTYADQGLSLSDMIAKWSPPGATGNSQTSYQNYVSSVASDTGLDPNTPIVQQLQVSSDSGSSLLPSSPDGSDAVDISSLDIGSTTSLAWIAGAAGVALLFFMAV